jgi:tetratricopeptide (TPR) repeat protein
MRSFWTDRRLILIPAVALVFGSQWAFAQKGGAGSPGSAGSAGMGNIGSPSRGNTPNPTFGNTPSNTSPTFDRPIFLSGKVIFDDGSPANTDIRIERVCSGSTRLEAHTDTKGRFSFQVGQNPMAFNDASDSPTDPSRNASGQYGAGGGYSRSPGLGTATGSSASNPLWNCELRASYPGYRSDLIDLTNRHSLDDPNVGTIVLHRLANVQGTTISVTSELAPKSAQKAYQKGVRAAQAGKMEEAEKQFQQATDIYPKYAVAWFDLGQLEQRAGKAELARKYYISATSADSKFLSPFDRLAFLSAQTGKWDDAADYSKHVIQLNPVEFPTSFWYNALANYQLHKPAEAEKSVTELLKLDTQHHFPEAENLMAQLLLDKGQYADAAVHLRSYLALAPNAKNADALKAMLSKIEQASAQTKPQAPQQ